MKDDRLRVPIDDPYLLSLGLATICFARLEWQVVYCCEKLEMGYIGTVAAKTAGMIANDFIGRAATHPDPAIRTDLQLQAAAFKQLVGRRNDLVHANPGTSRSGDQRLFRHGSEWTIAMIDDVADDFTAISLVLNGLYYNRM